MDAAREGLLDDPIDRKSSNTSGNRGAQPSTCFETSTSLVTAVASFCADSDFGSQETLRQAPEDLEEQFESDFERHLRNRNRLKRLTFSAVGVIGGGVIGFIALPVALHGLGIVALVGGVGGYQWAKTRGRRELEKHSRRSSTGSPQGGHMAEDLPMPTLRRLKYLAKWGHWQLLHYGDAPMDWQFAVLDEVVRAFFPWVQRMHFLRGSAVIDGTVTQMREVLQYLMPLYLFLQRRVVRETLFSAAGAVDIAIESHRELDHTDIDRCRFLFPIVLECIVEINKLESKTFEQLLRGASRHRRGLFSQHHEPRRHRLQQITQTLNILLERQEVLLALQEAPIRPYSMSPNNRRPSLVAETACSSQNTSDTFRDGLRRNNHGEQGSMPTLSNFLEPMNVPPLVVPPEGAEDEPGAFAASSSLGQDDEDDEFYSVDGDSDEENHIPVSPRRRAASADEENHTPVSPRRRTASSCQGEMCIEDRLVAFPLGEGPNTWRPFEEYTFNVRSETYLSDRKKEPSGPAWFEAVNMEIVHVGPAGPAWRVATHKDFFPQYRRRMGDNRFFVVHNWVFPPYQAILIGALDPKARWHQNAHCPQARLWRRFLDMEQEERRDLLKVIISIDGGPWIVKRAAPKKPVIIGRKVKMHTYHKPGDHLEFVMDISTSKSDEMIVAFVMRAWKGLQVSICTLLEGRHEDELPESLLFCGSVSYMDLSKTGYPEVDPDCHVKEEEQ